eukprot:1161129-Pelagomonas_calceolata.AAC.7
MALRWWSQPPPRSPPWPGSSSSVSSAPAKGASSQARRSDTLPPLNFTFSLESLTILGILRDSRNRRCAKWARNRATRVVRNRLSTGQLPGQLVHTQLPSTQHEKNERLEGTS